MSTIYDTHAARAVTRSATRRNTLGIRLKNQSKGNALFRAVAVSHPERMREIEVESDVNTQDPNAFDLFFIDPATDIEPGDLITKPFDGSDRLNCWIVVNVNVNYEGYPETAVDKTARIYAHEQLGY